MVRRETIDRVRANVGTCSDEALEQEFEGFFRNQGEICDFVMDLTSASRQSVRELTLYLSYVAYKSLAEDRGGFAEAVSPQTIAAACRESREWIEALSALGESEIESASTWAAGDEPYLLGYVITEVQEAVAGGLDLNEEEKGTVFFVLKTVIASLTTGRN